MKKQNNRHKSNLLYLYEKYGVNNANVSFNDSDKRNFYNYVKKIAEYQDVFEVGNKLLSAVEEVKNIVEMANNMMLEDTDGWFDDITVNRHIKQMNEALKILEKEASEISQRQQRIAAAFDDIGIILSKYYSI